MIDVKNKSAKELAELAYYSITRGIGLAADKALAELVTRAAANDDRLAAAIEAADVLTGVGFGLSRQVEILSLIARLRGTQPARKDLPPIADLAGSCPDLGTKQEARGEADEPAATPNPRRWCTCGEDHEHWQAKPDYRAMLIQVMSVIRAYTLNDMSLFATAEARGVDLEAMAKAVEIGGDNATG